jgi:hypothetical protein
MEGPPRKEEEADVKGLLDRLATVESPAESGWGSWGGWASSLQGAVSSVSATAAASLSSLSADSVAGAFNSITNEAQGMLSDTLQDLSSLASKTAEKAASVAIAVESALGLQEERTGFAAFFVQSGGLELNTDLKELAQRAADAVASMELSAETEAALKRQVSAYREPTDSGDDDGGKEDTIATVSGVDVSSVAEALKQHNMILVEAHGKLLQELKAAKGDDDKVAQTAVVNKNRMENLFSLGLLELLKRSFVLVSHQADVLTATVKGWLNRLFVSYSHVSNSRGVRRGGVADGRGRSAALSRRGKAD